jgi:tagatose 1,6-diphosphate aldolase
MCALDHRGSLQKMLKGVLDREPTYQDMVDFKLDVCRTLSSESSAILLDPLFGAAQSIASGLLAGNSGLVVRKLAADCAAQDLAFVVEPVGYPLGDEAATGGYAAIKPDIVIQTARDISPLGIDVLKAEFPADVKVEKDESKMLEFCKRLDEASQAPWIILSAGVDFPWFQREVEIACKAGASGFLAGRALWQEATTMKTRAERIEFFSTTVVERLRLISALANAYGTPWYKKTAAPSVVEGWYASY